MSLFTNPTANLSMIEQQRIDLSKDEQEVTAFSKANEALLKAVEIDEPANIDQESLITHYSKPLEMNDEMDLKYSLCIAKLLHSNKIDDVYLPKLISGMVLHFCDSRDSFVDRVRVLAAIFLKKDDFDIKTRSCYDLFLKYLPDELKSKKVEVSRKTQYERYGREVTNRRADTATARHVYLQQAIKILRNKEDLKAMKMVHNNIMDILGYTSQRTFKHHGNALYEVLIDLNTPSLYDSQSVSLAHFIKLNFEYYDNLLNTFFETKIETLQFYLIYSLEVLHDLLPFDKRVSLHLKFTERLISHDKVFEPPVRKEVEAFVYKGIDMLGQALP